MEWLMANKEITAAIIILIGTVVAAYIKGSSKSGNVNTNKVVNTNNVVINTSNKEKANHSVNGADSKITKKILFVDDDTSFQVVKILRRAGWANVKIVKDIDSIDSATILETDLFFIDIQGVGKSLGFTDEGLGLAYAIKTKYPEKKVVIYSAEPKGNRFHQAFRIANDFLPKTAEPYEFQQVVDNLLLFECAA